VCTARSKLDSEATDESSELHDEVSEAKRKGERKSDSFDLCKSLSSKLHTWSGLARLSMGAIN